MSEPVRVACCGRCWFERGVRVPLTLMLRRLSLSKTQWIDGGPQGKPLPYGCPFCCEERHEGGSHSRTTIISDGNHKGEESVTKIPHVVLF